MSDADDEFSKVHEFLILPTGLDEIIPYATLTVFNLPDKSLEKIARFFGLQICRQNSFSFLKMKDCKPGEHKLQTLDLLAAAICMHVNFPEVRTSLNVRHDFMKEPEKLEKKISEEIGSLSDGQLQISEACQIFLKQAGFHLEVRNASQKLDRSGWLQLAEQFQQISAEFKIPRGA